MRHTESGWSKRDRDRLSRQGKCHGLLPASPLNQEACVRLLCVRLLCVRLFGSPAGDAAQRQPARLLHARAAAARMRCTRHVHM